MSEIKATLSRLEGQKEQATTLKQSLDEYSNLIRTQHDLNLYCCAFFTANSVLDPVIGAALEYPKLKLGEIQSSGFVDVPTKSVVLLVVYILK